MTADNRNRERRIRVRGIRREQPDIGKLARAIVALAQAQIEAEAAAAHERTKDGTSPAPSDGEPPSGGRS